MNLLREMRAKRKANKIEKSHETDASVKSAILSTCDSIKNSDFFITKFSSEDMHSLVNNSTEKNKRSENATEESEPVKK